jgi:hypothetical protein
LVIVVEVEPMNSVLAVSENVTDDLSSTLIIAAFRIILVWWGKNSKTKDAESLAVSASKEFMQHLVCFIGTTTLNLDESKSFWSE